MNVTSNRLTAAAVALAVFGGTGAYAAPCLYDCSGNYDQYVGIDDMLALFGQWGTIGSCDLDADGVDVADFMALLGSWGPCPSPIEETPDSAESFGPQLTVVAVPWLGCPNNQHQVLDGATLTLQAVATEIAGCPLISAEWDPGDGGPSQLVAFGDPRELELAHTYNGLNLQPYTATITVEDSCANTASDTFRVVVRVPLSVDEQREVEVNMAIDHGLWNLHKRQVLAMSGGVDTGFWASQNTAAATGSAVQAYEINNHLESGNDCTGPQGMPDDVPDTFIDEDPYIDDVARGLAHVMTELSSVNIGLQPAGDPDANGNGIGLQANVGSRPIYVTGQVVDAIAASRTPGAVAITGGANVLGETYGDIIQDTMDMYSWGQADFGSDRGGWRYSWNNDADNSACQWWAIGGIAAENLFASTIPQFVKDENLNFWLPFSQTFDGTFLGNDGRFGYTSAGAIVDINGMNTTPSGLVQLNLDGVQTTGARWDAAQAFMVRNWTSLVNTNRIYGMFATAKAMRLALPAPVVIISDPNAGSIDWYDEDTLDGDAVNGLARHLVSTQHADGSWDGSGWVIDDLASAWAVIILSPTIVQLGPIAVCEADPQTTGVGDPIEFDGSNSFHLDSPNHEIVDYEWDFDGDNIVDDTGPIVNHAFNSLGTFNVTLTVKDDNVPLLQDQTTCTVEIIVPPIPPNADPGGPYCFGIGQNEPFILNGTNSSDLDGVIVTYEWDFDPQPLDNSHDDAFTPTVDVTAFFTGLGPGAYDAALRVTDNDGLDNTDFTTILVTDASCPPPDVIGSLDIKPGSCPNSFNRNSNGVLPVSLVGSPTLDVTQVDITTLELSRKDGIGGSATPNEGPPGPHTVIDDTATPFPGEPCDCHELEGDGTDDLSMKFKSNDVVEALELNDLPAGDLVNLTLTGSLLDGTPFAVNDCIRLVPPGTASGALAIDSNLPGVWVDVSPLDEQLDSGGFTGFDRTFAQTTEVTMVVPMVPSQYPSRILHSVWIDGVPTTFYGGGSQVTLDITINGNHSVAVMYTTHRGRFLPPEDDTVGTGRN